jgi:hypothetical protein
MSVMYVTILGVEIKVNFVLHSIVFRYISFCMLLFYILL